MKGAESSRTPAERAGGRGLRAERGTPLPPADGRDQGGPEGPAAASARSVGKRSRGRGCRGCPGVGRLALRATSCAGAGLGTWTSRAWPPGGSTAAGCPRQLPSLFGKVFLKRPPAWAAGRSTRWAALGGGLCQRVQKRGVVGDGVSPRGPQPRPRARGLLLRPRGDPVPWLHSCAALGLTAPPPAL